MSAYNYSSAALVLSLIHILIIFESDTPMGKLFDVALIGFIVLSILVVIAESIKSWDAVIGPYLRVSEYVFTFCHRHR